MWRFIIYIMVYYKNLTKCFCFSDFRVLEHMLKHMKNGSLSICSNIWKMGPWAYAQTYEKWVLERTLKHMKNGSLSVHSKAVWAYAQGPIKWPFERTLNGCLSVRSKAVWAYAQGPKKWPFERMLNDPKNDPLSIHWRTHFRCTFSHA